MPNHNNLTLHAFYECSGFFHNHMDSIDSTCSDTCKSESARLNLCEKENKLFSSSKVFPFGGNVPWQLFSVIQVQGFIYLNEERRIPQIDINLIDKKFIIRKIHIFFR